MSLSLRPLRASTIPENNHSSIENAGGHQGTPQPAAATVEVPTEDTTLAYNLMGETAAQWMIPPLSAPHQIRTLRNDFQNASELFRGETRSYLHPGRRVPLIHIPHVSISGITYHRLEVNKLLSLMGTYRNDFRSIHRAMEQWLRNVPGAHVRSRQDVYQKVHQIFTILHGPNFVAVIGELQL